MGMNDHPDSASNGRFELSGGALCLDFANSAGFRGDPARDQLRDYEALLAFAGEAGILDEGRRGSFGGASPATAAAVLAEAVALRELLYGIFTGAARGEAVPTDDLELLNRMVAEAHAALRLCCVGEFGCEWQWDDARTAEPRALLWPIVRSAAQLLTSSDLGRVRECKASDCNWLFVDRSRSRRRRWCSMESCGNREKARRHYRRTRKAAQ